MAEAKRDGNSVPTLIGVSSSDGATPTNVYVDPTTHRMLVDIPGGSGSVTSVSVVTANGFAGTVATATTTPAITLTTTVTGILKGNGTAISAATSGTDYSLGTSALATGIVKTTTATGALTIAVAGDFPTLNQNTSGTAANVTGIVAPANGGTGIANNASSTLAISGAFATTLTVSNTTAVTLPTSGTLYGTAASSISSAQLAGSLSDETGSGLAVFGTTPTISTPVINGLATGTGVASAATASTLMTRDANANASVNNILQGFTSTATAAGTTTLVVGSTVIQVFTGSTTQTVALPTTSIVAGQQFIIVNKSTGAVTVQSSGANTITVLAANTSGIFTALVATPTTAANWNSQYLGLIVTSGKSLSVSNTLTLAGTDATTMTFPTTSATIARTDAANTFTGTQTFSTIAAPASASVNINAGSYNTIQTYAPGAGGTATLDLSLGNVHHITMPAGNITIALSNTSAGQCFIIRILQDGTGSRTVTWFTTIKWAGGSAPTLTTTASKADTLGFEVTTAGSAYDGYIVGQNI